MEKNCTDEVSLITKCIIKLQIVKRFPELVAWSDVETFAHEEGELVGVLAGGGDPHGAGPVVLKMTQLVRQLLDVLGLEAATILDHVVRGWVDGSLPHGLAHEEEVVPLRQGDDVVDHSPGWWV